MQLRDLTDQVFGRLTAKCRLSPARSRRTPWLCECRCGNITTVVSQDLINRHTQSCGCQKFEKRTKPGESARRAVMDSYRCAAISRGYKWAISEEDWNRLTQLPCQYCGAAPATKAKTQSRHGEFIYNGLDRADNMRGYELDNVVPCCPHCNRAKRMMTVTDFLSWARRVVKFNEVN
jgi:hypothetical protein